MNMRDSVKTAFSNLKRRKMRTFLTSFAVAIGTMLIIVMVGLGIGIQNLVIDSIKEQGGLNEITVSKKIEMDIDKNGSTTKQKQEKEKIKLLDYENVERIKKIKDVEEVQIRENVFVNEIELNGKKNDMPNVEGLDLEYSIFPKSKIEAARIKNKDKAMEPISYGRSFTEKDKDVAIISEKFLTELGITDYKSVLDKEIKLSASMMSMPGMPEIKPYEVKLKVIGVINQKYDKSQTVLVPMQTAVNIKGYMNNDSNYYKKQGLSSVTVIANDVKNVKAISDEISKMGYTTSSPEEIIKLVKTIFAILQGILATGGLIVIFVASLGVINTMTMAIYERTRSIGIMKALGASKVAIRRMFITESGAIGFIGGIMGLFLGWMNIKIISLGINMYIKSKGIVDKVTIFAMPWWLVLGSLAFAVLIAILAGLYPAGKAARLDPIESLRHE